MTTTHRPTDWPVDPSPEAELRAEVARLRALLAAAQPDTCPSCSAPGSLGVHSTRAGGTETWHTVCAACGRSWPL